MNGIGFQNFKRFKDLDPLTLAPVTFLVGTNNAGKSSFIKGAMLLLNNLGNNVDPGTPEATCPIRRFSFNDQTRTHHGWGDFSSSLSREADGNDIVFIWEQDDFTFRLSAGATPEEIARDSSLRMTVPVERLGMRSRTDEKEIAYVLDKASGKYLVESALAPGEFPAFDAGAKRALERAARVGYIYVESHNATHDEAIVAKDKNNVLAQTIGDFISNVSPVADSRLYEWINGWLAKFHVGESFEIIQAYGGEIYEVNIFRSMANADDSRDRVALARLGTGSIQIFILLLKIATAMKACMDSTTGRHDSIIMFIEEPEQNLHPAWQSHIADLLYDVNRWTADRIRFVVETHSEYIIRRTQVIVAGMQLGEEDIAAASPFRVYYFPEDGVPYDMRYHPSGHFEEAFGPGFFDEAGKWTRELIRFRHK